MFIEDTFHDWTETCIRSITLQELKYIRTFSIDEFKQIFSLDSIYVKQHPGGFLFFEASRLDWGLVYGKDSLIDPVISVVIDYWGNLFFLMHKKDDMPEFIRIDSTAQHKRMLLKAHRDRSSYRSSYMSRYEYEAYLDECYEDAFEGDPDAYWNID